MKAPKDFEPSDVPHGDPAGQAVDSLRGYAYQLYASALAWLELSAGEDIYLEVAQDYATAARDALNAVQVKDVQANITINSADVRQAIDDFVDLVKRNPARRVSLRFLTTSEIGREREITDQVAGQPTLKYWREAAAGADVLPLRKILGRLKLNDETKAYISASNDEQLRSDLLGRISWDCGAPEFDDLKQRLEERVITFANDRLNASPSTAKLGVAAILQAILENAVQPESSQRKLSLASLLEVLEKTTHVWIPRSALTEALSSTIEKKRNIFRPPYRANPNFIGRDDTLSPLRAKMIEHKAIPVTAICGLGGVGKTTIATEYCYRFKDAYAGIWTLHAEQRATMLADLQELAQKLGVESSQNIEADARAALEYLEAAEQSWLLVYDNAPNPDSVREWLPKKGVHSLITSRYSDFSEVAAVFNVDEWPEEVATEYLLSRTGRTDRDGARALAIQLGGLPLAAEQSAVYLRSRPGITFGAYGAEFDRIIRTPRSRERQAEYRDTVFAAFMKSIEAVKDSSNGERALDLLRLLAFLSPDRVPLGMLSGTAARQHLPAELGASLAHETAREDVLSTLSSFSLLQRPDAFDGAVLIIHRLLQAVFRDWMSESERERWAGVATEVVNAVVPDEHDPQTDSAIWPYYSEIIVPQLAALEAYAPTKGAPAKAFSRLLHETSMYFVAVGELEDGILLAERNVKIRRTLYPNDPLMVGITLNQLGTAYILSERFEEAEQPLGDAVAIAQAAKLPSTDDRLAVWSSNLAHVYDNQGKFDKAEPIFRQAMEIMKAVHGTKSWKYGQALSILGDLYSRGYASGKANVATFRSARKYLIDGLETTRTDRGYLSPQTALCYQNLARHFGIARDLQPTFDNQRKSAAIYLRLHGPANPDTRFALSQLEEILRADKRDDVVAALRAGDFSLLTPIIQMMEAEDARRMTAE